MAADGVTARAEPALARLPAPVLARHLHPPRLHEAVALPPGHRPSTAVDRPTGLRCDICGSASPLWTPGTEQRLKHERVAAWSAGLRTFSRWAASDLLCGCRGSIRRGGRPRGRGGSDPQAGHPTVDPQDGARGGGRGTGTRGRPQPRRPPRASPGDRSAGAGGAPQRRLPDPRHRPSTAAQSLSPRRTGSRGHTPLTLAALRRTFRTCS
jgi:hypothetical protein